MSAPLSKTGLTQALSKGGLVGETSVQLFRQTDQASFFSLYIATQKDVSLSFREGGQGEYEGAYICT